MGKSSDFLRVSILLQHLKSASATARLLSKETLSELKVSLLFPLLGSNPSHLGSRIQRRLSEPKGSSVPSCGGTGAPRDSQGPDRKVRHWIEAATKSPLLSKHLTAEKSRAFTLVLATAG